MRYVRHRWKALGLLGAVAMLLLAPGAQRGAKANDGIFPPAPAAKPFIDFDGRGFLIAGKRTFLTSGGIEYARVPRALWRDRLLRFKRAGFNTVEIYNFWNFHEPQDGQFDFTGDHDLDAFLKLVKALGMYCVARVGPYYCAEWDSGGYPIWLRFKPGVRVREDNAEFEKYVDRFFDKIIPILAANQINRGGSVIMVQLENEHPAGWGTEIPNGYFRHLRDKAISLGLEVPHFFSGLHHGSDPAGNDPWDSANRTNPWYTTEFWPGWYSDYGPLNAGDFRRFDRGDWKILAYGGNGYNFYMLHGGTNFGYTNNNEDAASYDYGAAVGQAGDLRPIYYRFKRTAWFARSFPEILENSDNDTDEFTSAATSSDVRVTARKSAAGTILFLDNRGDAALKTQVKGPDGRSYPSAGPITLAPGEIMPVVEGATITPNVLLALSAARILAIDRQASVTTLVAYGPAGDPGELQFTTTGAASVGEASGAWQKTGADAYDLKFTFPAGKPQEFGLKAGGDQIRILVMSDSLADRTWFVSAGGKSYVVCGPAYVGDAELVGGHLRLVTENPARAQARSTIVYGPGMDGATFQESGASVKEPTSPALTHWEQQTVPCGAPGFDASSWTSGDEPQQMGFDGDLSAYAWYRTKVSAPTDGRYTLAKHGGDKLITFVDGVRLPDSGGGRSGVQMDLKAGSHDVAIFAAHYGRDKLFNYLGPIADKDAKGIEGPVTLRQGLGGVAITDWRWMKADSADEPIPAVDNPGWQKATIGQDVFNKQRGFAWYQTTLPASAEKHHSLHFESVDDNGTVYLNGKKLTEHKGWDDPFDVDLDAVWSADGPNLLSVLVENTANTGGIAGPVALATSGQSDLVSGWRMHGGPGGPLADSTWKPLGPASAAGFPSFYRARFTAAPPPAVGAHPIWRAVMTGMSAGFVWLNGHNLGRYPEKVPVTGLYLPECWLNPGGNTLVIFDEDGKQPTSVSIQEEKPASRVVGAVSN